MHTRTVCYILDIMLLNALKEMSGSVEEDKLTRDCHMVGLFMSRKQKAERNLSSAGCSL